MNGFSVLPVIVHMSSCHLIASLSRIIVLYCRSTGEKTNSVTFSHKFVTNDYQKTEIKIYLYFSIGTGGCGFDSRVG